MGDKIRLQIVDDSLLIRKKLIGIAEGLGYEVAGVAADGFKALEQYSEVNPDIVIMDVAMPLISGLETIERLIDQDPEARIIMVSALNQKKMVIEALEKGAKHFIIKPFVRDSLREAIEMVMEASEE